jgi:hypothetical protein
MPFSSELPLTIALHVLFYRLTGKFVFSGKNYKDILKKNTECIVPYPPQFWGKLSAESKELV